MHLHHSLVFKGFSLEAESLCLNLSSPENAFYVNVGKIMLNVRIIVFNFNL